MAGVSIDSGGGGKKKVDLTIPLVPMIDMLAIMITFLMATAVWTEIGKLQVSQAPTGPSDSSTPPPTPTLTLTLTLTSRGYTLAAGSELVEIPFGADGSYDHADLLKKLKEIKKDHPDHRAVTVAAEDSVEYQHLVLAVDKCLEAEFPDVSVTPAMGA